MRKTLLSIVGAMIALVSLAQTGHAETGCDAAVGSHDIAASACDPVLNFTVIIAGEPVDVTVVADASLGITPRRAGEIRTIVDRTAMRLSDMALTGFPDITIAVADGLADDAGDADGVTSLDGSDCLIALAGPALDGDTGLLRHTTAHELFHCAQYLLQPTRADLASAAWWSEGSAEWFANLVYPGTGYSAGYVSQFDAESVDTPVTAMDYPAAVFFAWYGQTYGSAAIADFIRGLAGSADDLANTIGEDGWWVFSDAYFDQTIRWPGGAPLPSTPARGPSFSFADSTRERLEADRYVLYRADLVFEAGYWTLENDVEAGRYDVGDGGEQLPDAIEAACEEPTRFRLHGGSVEASGFRLIVDATLAEEPACTGCIEAPEIDRCLVGTWQYSAGGAADWMRRQMGPDVTISVPSTGDPNVIFRSNGTYRAFQTGRNAIITTEDGYGEILASTVAAGRWSTSGSSLHICEDELDASGPITVEVPGISETTDLGNYVGPGTAMTLDYSCSADLLITELRFPGIPDPMVTNYTRATPAGTR